MNEDTARRTVSMEKRIFTLGVIAFIIILITICAVAHVINTQSMLEKQREACENAIKLFLDGSDILTAEAFAYADTCDQTHMRGYWTEANVTRSRDKAIQILKAYRLSELEEEALDNAAFLSNDLMEAEVHAQRLIAESVAMKVMDMPEAVAAYTLPKAERELVSKGKYSLANELLFGRSYTSQKNEIVRTVQKFSYHLNSRFGTMAVSNMKLAWFFIAVGFSAFIITTYFLMKNSQASGAEHQKELQKEIEDARFRDEYLRIALSQMNKHLIRYDILTGTFTLESAKNARAAKQLDKLLEVCGTLSDAARQRLRNMCASIEDGKPIQKTDICIKEQSRGERWLRFDSTTMFGDDGCPRMAVITFFDCTELLEHELAYVRVQQMYSSLPMDRVILLECNLTRDTYERKSGGLMPHFELTLNGPFESQTRAYVDLVVAPEDKAAVTLFMNRERLMGAFQGGRYTDSMECRAMGEKQYRWVSISVQMVPYLETNDIKLYMTLMDIDKEKRSSLELIHTAECDPLTGVYNRKTFERMVTAQLGGDKSGKHMLIMLDIDDFKAINDTFGHDRADIFLQDFTNGIKTELRSGDIVGRIGGDEFMVLMVNVASPEAMRSRAKTFISRLPLQMGSSRMMTTVSMGVSVFPNDGSTFSELYKKADIALYMIKKNGKNSFCFYKDGMEMGSNVLTKFDS